MTKNNSNNFISNCFFVRHEQFNQCPRTPLVQDWIRHRHSYTNTLTGNKSFPRIQARANIDSLYNNPQSRSLLLKSLNIPRYTANGTKESDENSSSICSAHGIARRHWAPHKDAVIFYERLIDAFSRGDYIRNWSSVTSTAY